ncbi:MAG: DUF349 domain-containing protein [Flavobacterium sp.]|nr:DUF349 domain-containing protein [Candidatus Neoflavobacterium equi]
MLEQNDNLQFADGKPEEENQNQTNLQEVLDAINNTNAEENEDEAIKIGQEIPMLNYEALSLESLVEELKHLTDTQKVMSIRNHVDEIKKVFLQKYHYFIDEKRDEYSNENNGDTTGFEYHLPAKNKFDEIYTHYKEQRNTHYNNLQKDLKSNLSLREELIEELKSLIETPQDSIQDTLKQINDIKERWKHAGPIPRDKYNHVWNNFHFHVERFYDQLNLDRTHRDLDLKNNLDQKVKIIEKVKTLLSEQDINKAFRELQTLHKIWKEEIGPVPKEKREEIWNEFSELTKQIHDRREEFFNVIKEKEMVNLAKKKAIIAKIASLSEEKINSHSGWQNQIKHIEILREAFFNTGKVPTEINEQTWAEFKQAVRDFNAHKNAFYKDIKKNQQDNLNKKMALLERAKELKDSNDFQATTPLMKQIQEEWKTIGHVPRKHSDLVWKEFKDACNYYFDRFNKKKNENNEEETTAFENKKAFLEDLKSYELTGDHKVDLDHIKKHIENWKSLGKVAQNRRHIEGKFNKILDALFDKLSLSKKDADLAKFNNKMEQISSNKDQKSLYNEQIFIQRKVEELQQNIFQLENNIQFITNAKSDNPLVKEIYKNIEKHKEELATWKEKQQHLRNIKLD